MADNLKNLTGGMPGSTQGQIKTPMATENVKNKGGGEIHSYKGTFTENSPGGSKMKTDDSIKGPGQKGAYPKKGKY